MSKALRYLVWSSVGLLVASPLNLVRFAFEPWESDTMGTSEPKTVGKGREILEFVSKVLCINSSLS